MTLDVPVELMIPGLPAPKGSLKCVGRGGMHRLVEDNPRTRAWRRVVAREAEAVDARADHWQPIGVDAVFVLPRPASHYRTGRNAALLRDNAPLYPTHLGTGDVDKLLRLILDALQDAHLLHDDAQVVWSSASKHWEGDGDVTGVHITVSPVDPDLAALPTILRAVETVHLPGDGP